MSAPKADPAERPDIDNPEWTPEMFARAKPALEVVERVFGREAADGLRKRGRPSKPDRKVNQTLRLDPDVIAAFRDSGAGWQARVNDVLRDHLAKAKR